MGEPKTETADSLQSGGIQIDPRYLSSGLITLILVFGQMYVGFLHDLSQLSTAIAVALLADLVLGRVLTGKWINPASAYITGISLRHSAPLTLPVALRDRQPAFRYVEIRPSLQGTAPVESFQPRHLRGALLGAWNRGGPQRAVGERPVGHGRDLGTGVGHSLAGETIPRILHPTRHPLSFSPTHER